MAESLSTYSGGKWSKVNDVSVYSNSTWKKLQKGMVYKSGVWEQFWPVGSLPVGTLAYWATAAAPAGWAVCDGSTVSAASYPELATVLGTTWGPGGSVITLPSLVTGEYLVAASSSSGSVATKHQAQIRKSHLSFTSNVTGSISDTNASWSGRLNTNRTGDHNHLAPESGWNSANSENNFSGWIGHTGGGSGEGHRGADGTWNYMTFNNLINDHHSHPTADIHLQDAGNHNHNWSGQINTEHNHSIPDYNTTHTIPGITQVEIDAITLLPIIYLGG